MEVQEIWESIKDYEGLYEVSNLGRVKGLKRSLILKPHIQNTREYTYYVVGLSKNGKVKQYLVHRLVAETFIPNPLNFTKVKHLDENSLNNVFYNLQWFDDSRVITYGNHYRRIKDRKKRGWKYASTRAKEAD